MTTSTQKVNLNNCTHEQIFKAVSKIKAKAAVTFIKDSKRIGHHMKVMVEHFVVSSDDNLRTTK